MTMNSKKNARTPSKAGVKTITAERALAVRLQELGVDSGGLPPHVTAHLRALVDDEAKRVSNALAAKIAELEAKSGEQLRDQVARLVTFRSVGKAFALPTAKPPGGAANERA
jgi:hypothetical protein